MPVSVFSLHENRYFLFYLYVLSLRSLYVLFYSTFIRFYFFFFLLYICHGISINGTNINKSRDAGDEGAGENATSEVKKQKTKKITQTDPHTEREQNE